jgi:hypothetical protein
MWNFRAYEERDFYRVDHFMAAMGVLCHPNFQEEKSNGVGISIDPIYDTQGTFYLNTQVGESLITNPDPNSVPEEILLYEDPTQGGGYLVLRLSNLVNPGELVMDVEYLDQMREYLSVIHDEFEILYDVVDAEGFGMDIEYKVTAQDQLAIKQARPWVSFWADINGDYDLGVTAFVEPQSSASLGNNELVTVTVANQGLNDMSDFEVELLVGGQSIETISVSQTIEPFSDADFQFSAPQNFSGLGDYNLSAIVSHEDDEYGNNDTLNYTLTKVYEFDGALSLGELSVVCDDDVELDINISNEGEATITNVALEVIVNGAVVDLINASVDIPFLEQGSVTISIDDNLQAENNDITVSLLSVNGQLDGDLTNNSASTITNLDSNYDIVTLMINPDNYPGETSWEIFDANDVLINSGDLPNGNFYTEDICLDYESCYSLYFYDSYGDGICCGFGIGDFQIVNSSGEQLVVNDGDFGSEAVEVFCPNGTGCDIDATVNITHASSPSANDGEIIININSGLSPFEYSINGGQSFQSSNAFSDLSTGSYVVLVQGGVEDCFYEETVVIEACELTSVDISSIDASSVVSTNGSIEINPTSGTGPYLYSIDGGQNYETFNLFENLPVGPYNVVVQDESNICSYEEVVPIEVEPLGLDGEFFSNGIIVYPNPTKNDFIVEIESLSALSEDVTIEVYDPMGRTIQTGSISKEGSGKTKISLGGYVSGTYFIKCGNQSFEKHFKVVKL